MRLVVSAQCLQQRQDTVYLGRGQQLSPVPLRHRAQVGGSCERERRALDNQHSAAGNSADERHCCSLPHSYARVHVTQAGRKELLDKYWLNAVSRWLARVCVAHESVRSVLDAQVLSCIGGRLDSDNQICGLVVSIKKAQDRISIWTRTSSDAAGVKAIGRRLKVDMGLPENVSISYAPHFSSTAARGKTSIYEV